VARPPSRKGLALVGIIAPAWRSELAVSCQRLGRKDFEAQCARDGAGYDEGFGCTARLSQGGANLDSNADLSRFVTRNAVPFWCGPFQKPERIA